MLTFHFIRHGETESSAEGVFSGDLDPPLLPAGVAQAERLAPLVARIVASPKKKVIAFVSPKTRARQTAAPTCRALGVEPTVDDGLREIAYGSWEGRREADVRGVEADRFAAWVADPALVAPPGGEGAFDIAGRALPVIARVVAAERDAHVLFFSHKATIRVVTCALLGVPLARFRDRITCETASVTTFDLAERGPILVRLGERA